MPRGDVGGEDGAARRAAFHQPDGELGGALKADDPAAGMHQEDRAIGPLRAQTVLQPSQIGFHQRLDIGVGDGGVEPLVFPHLRADFGREGDHRARHPLRKHFGDQPFMRVVDIGVQEADRDAFIARLGQIIGQRLHLRPVQRGEDAAVGIHPLRQHIAAVAGEERFGEIEVQVVLFEPAFGAHLDNVTETFRRDQRSLRPPPFDQRIGGERGAVDNLADGGGGDARLGADLMQALNDSVFGGGVGRQHLGGDHAIGGLHHHVGEGAADIHAQSDRRRHEPIPIGCFRAA